MPLRAEDARTDFLAWLAAERRASAKTVTAYAADTAAFLGFLTGHLGKEPTLTDLNALRQADLRAWQPSGWRTASSMPPAPATSPPCAASSASSPAATASPMRP